MDKSLGKTNDSIEAGDWSTSEIDAAVSAYVEMLQHEQTGRSYNKAEFNRKLRAGILSGRSKGSIEFRMQNISSVLSDHLLRWIQGYKPAVNVGSSVYQLIEESLERKGMFVSADYTPTPDQELLERKVRQLRKRALVLAPKGSDRPEVQTSSATTYVRDPAVKAWVLQEAKGVCEGCGSPAPFVTEYGEPFLEVHHVRLLAKGGSDRVTNAAALCPNCHRRCHLSADREAFKKQLYDRCVRLEQE